VLIVIDTPVWSEIFRRPRPDPDVLAHVMQLSDTASACVLGPIRQEVLSGVKSRSDFVSLRTAMRAIPELPIESSDYDDAAEMYNKCRAGGVQGGHVDLLIIAVAVRHGARIYTFDRDFTAYDRLIPVPIHAGPRPPARP
jgi:predicted nucleic acid-binding protein